jgi:hypothetical protein
MRSILFGLLIMCGCFGPRVQTMYMESMQDVDTTELRIIRVDTVVEFSGKTFIIKYYYK